MKNTLPTLARIVLTLMLVIGFTQTLMSQATRDDPHPWTAPRTPDGQPDLQGVWANNTATPMERPEIFRGQAELTPDELQGIKERAEEILSGANEQAGEVFGDFLFRAAAGEQDIRVIDPEIGNYNTFWLADRNFDDTRTSLIVDPPTGRRPPLTEAALTRVRRQGGGRPEGGPMSFSDPDNPDGPEDLGLVARCISYGVPWLLPGYNAIFQILQTPDHVIIMQELIHDARIIPLDGRSHLNQRLRQWHGDSRGYFEGDTLVVETTNFSVDANKQGASENLRIIERFTRVAPETIHFEVTFDDPTTWTQPWTALILLAKAEGALFEYACHEGNYAMEGILAGARGAEQLEANNPR